MSEKFRLLAMGGDGIGPEVLSCGLAVFEAVASNAGIAYEIEHDLLHGAAWDAYGTFCREETVARAKAADAVLVGGVGGPKWDHIKVPGGPEMQDGLMRLRIELDVYIGLRPAVAMPCLEHLTPYREGLITGADVMVLRELCGGSFFGLPRGIDQLPDGRRRGYDNYVYDSNEIERFAHAGFRMARQRRGKLTSIDKANVMECFKLWREIVSEVAREYPDVTLDHMHADNCIYQVAMNPRAFDVILADNMLGDIVSDQLGCIAGSKAMLPSACLKGLPLPGQRIAGIYEPSHGTAPDIVGKGIANPLGTLLSVAMLFEYSLARPDLARDIAKATQTALESGCLPTDLGGTADSASVTRAVLASLAL
jgi:3-isopropylmalate dehydrogenase